MKIKDAINYFGSQKKLADALEVSPAAISNWRGRDQRKLLPPYRAMQVERLTQGALRFDERKYKKRK